MFTTICHSSSHGALRRLILRVFSLLILSAFPLGVCNASPCEKLFIVSTFNAVQAQTAEPLKGAHTESRNNELQEVDAEPNNAERQEAKAEPLNAERQEVDAVNRRMNRIIFWSALVVGLLLAAVIASLWYAFRQQWRSAELLRRLMAAHEALITAKAEEKDRVQGLQGREEVRVQGLLSVEEDRVQGLQGREEVRVQGLQGGADAILPHPSNIEEQNVGSEGHQPPTPLSLPSDQLTERVQEVILRLMPQGNLDVDSIAADLCLSPSQLRRKMNIIMGMSPKKFIMKVRMEAAREMLNQHPDMKLSDIADRCGFYDLSHFIRLYKETYGTTPAADHRTA